MRMTLSLLIIYCLTAVSVAFFASWYTEDFRDMIITFPALGTKGSIPYCELGKAGSTISWSWSAEQPTVTLLAGCLLPFLSQSRAIHVNPQLHSAIMWQARTGVWFTSLGQTVLSLQRRPSPLSALRRPDTGVADRVSIAESPVSGSTMGNLGVGQQSSVRAAQRDPPGKANIMVCLLLV